MSSSSIKDQSGLYIQSSIEKSFLNKKNIYISGVGGTGKSHLIKHLYHKYKTNTTFLCSSTGISAYNIGGRTIHSWAGFIYPSNIDDPERILKITMSCIKKDRTKRIRWKTTSVLFIDEISMLGGSYLTLLDTVGRLLRDPHKPLGGIQIVCTGDMLQLPPVNDVYPFEVDVWKNLSFQTYNLNICYRFDDMNFTEILKRARVGTLNNKDIEILKSRMNLNIDNDIKPTIILPTNSEVDRINRNKLDKLEGETVIFPAQDYVYNREKEIVKENIPKDVLDGINCDNLLHIKVGAQVMLTINKDIDTGMVNGARGIVKSITKISILDDSIITVKFINGRIEHISPHEFTIEEDDRTYVRIGFPLKVCFAITFHKVQGLTLDCVYVDIGSNIFCAGQAYVGLSRCKNLDSLYLLSFNPKKIYPNKTALQFDISMKDSIISEM